MSRVGSVTHGRGNPELHGRPRGGAPACSKILPALWVTGTLVTDTLGYRDPGLQLTWVTGNLIYRHLGYRHLGYRAARIPALWVTCTLAYRHFELPGS